MMLSGTGMAVKIVSFFFLCLSFVSFNIESKGRFAGSICSTKIERLKDVKADKVQLAKDLKASKAKHQKDLSSAEETISEL